jgi:hypothetical protein
MRNRIPFLKYNLKTSPIISVEGFKSRQMSKIDRLIQVSKLKSAGYEVFLITRKVLDARRRGATTEAYGAIRRKEEGSKATPPFGFAQGREPVERQMMP